MADSVAGQAGTVAMAGPPAEFRDLLASGLRDRGWRTTGLESEGRIEGVVHSCVEPAALVACDFGVLDDQGWDDRCEAVLRAALDTCRRAHSRRGDGARRLVFVTPCLSLDGAPGLAAHAAALEGVRAMAKSAARQWGAEGMTVNCVAPAVQGGPAPLERPALERFPAPRHEVAAVVAFLLSDAAAGVTGATITVDGGSLMRP